MPPDELDPVIHQPTRLRIMVLLYQNRQAAATWVRDTLGLTDGNLGSHSDRLAHAGYVDVGRTLTPTGFQVRLRMTEKGDAAFRDYLARLRGFLQLVPADAGVSQRPSDAPPP